MATLTLQLPNLPPVEHVLKDEAITIGRMKGNTIALDDVSVSLSHAKLTLRDGGYFLKDLNSTNGTMVNGQSVTEAHLHDGDHIKFGEVTGRFHAGDAPMPNPTTTPAMSGVPANAPVPPPAIPMQTRILQGASFRPRPAKKSPWLPLALKIAGLAVIGLLLWKFIFKTEPPPAFTLQPESPAKPAPASAVSTAKPPVSASVQTSETNPASQPSPSQISISQRIATLINSLKSSDVAERRRAIAALNTMQADALPAVPALRETLKDSDAEVRTWAALTLISNRVYDPAAVPILMQALHHENPTLRQVASLSLGLIPFSEAEKEPVIAALTECVSHDANADVRQAALSALKMVAHDSAPTGK